MSSKLVLFVQKALHVRGDPAAAPKMAKYVKTTMPFYGVSAPKRHEVLKELKSSYKPTSTEELCDMTDQIWSLSHREEKYLAVDFLRAHVKKFPSIGVLVLSERMIREGAWWDFVDSIASGVLGPLLQAMPDPMWSTLDTWIKDPDMWIRRSAILAQLDLKAKVDEPRLFSYCLRCASESDFFIRKAIGWSLRQYARFQPDRVLGFVRANREQLSRLSIDQALKHLGGRAVLDSQSKRGQSGTKSKPKRRAASPSDEDSTADEESGSSSGSDDSES
jgi:3-methyladenine DNA glycosylase AlkD